MYEQFHSERVQALHSETIRHLQEHLASWLAQQSDKHGEATIKNIRSSLTPQYFVLS